MELALLRFNIKVFIQEASQDYSDLSDVILKVAK